MKVERDSLESKLFNVIDETSSTCLATRAFPQETRGVNEITEEDWSGNVTKETENDKLHSERE